jgi:hypothetical protein
LDEPRPGRPRTIADADVERVITTTLESTPKDGHPGDRRAPQLLAADRQQISAVTPLRAGTEKVGLLPLRAEGQRGRRGPDFVSLPFGA